MSYISANSMQIFSAPAAYTSSAVAPAGVVPVAIAPTTQATNIMAAASSSNGVGGRIVQFLITTWQDFSFWSRSIMGRVTAAEIQNFDSERLSRISSSILNRLSIEEATKLLTWANEGDSRLTALLPAIIKNLKFSKIETLIPQIRVTFEKLATINPCALKKILMAQDKDGNTQMHQVMYDPVTITDFMPVLNALAKAAPSSFHETLKEIMMAQNKYGKTPMHQVMLSPDTITAFIPALNALEEADPSSFHDTIKKMMMVKTKDARDWVTQDGSTPMHLVMFAPATIKAFIPILTALAEADPSSFHDMLKEMMRDKNNRGETPMYRVMCESATIKAFMPVLTALATADRSSFHDMLKEMMRDKNNRGVTPMHIVMCRADRVTAFIPVLNELANPSSFHDTIMMYEDGRTPMNWVMSNANRIKAFILVLETLSNIGMNTNELNEIMQTDMDNGKTLIHTIKDVLPPDDFKNFLRKIA